jgi:hypothetical protein
LITLDLLQSVEMRLPSISGRLDVGLLPSDKLVRSYSCNLQGRAAKQDQPAHVHNQSTPHRYAFNFLSE